MTQSNSRRYLFESMPIPKAVMEPPVPMAVTPADPVMPAAAAVWMLLRIFRQRASDL